jgi:hypothetical protein
MDAGLVSDNRLIYPLKIAESQIWNSRTQEIEAGKDVCRTTE